MKKCFVGGRGDLGNSGALWSHSRTILGPFVTFFWLSGPARCGQAFCGDAPALASKNKIRYKNTTTHGKIKLGLSGRGRTSFVG